MPEFTLTVVAEAPVEEVWKLLYDPGRFPEWWAGVEAVDPDPARGPDPGSGSGSGAGETVGYTMFPVGYPDFPMAQQLRTERADGRVTISCLVSDLEFCWQLREAGDGTRIEVHVRLPEKEALRLPAQRAIIEESIQRLATLAG
jgi:hypothetical protein